MEANEGRTLARESAHDLPESIWLCPVHAEHFYVPHGGTCPEPGCGESTVRYVRLDLVREALEQRYSPQLDKIAAALTLHPADCVDQRFGDG